ncbi:hypothetical protein [Levilactobacillus lindianensis]|uniref:hypothetical protein n=1 Tax=Levilactobacillus lindianensis TaxID=2486018 RepID=UPI000F7361E5|nr:hypothetical protein [Levilactobacillus lindianensis]
MLVLTSIFAYKKIQFFLRLSIYFVLGIVVLVFRSIHKRKTRKRMDERTEYMMKHTEKNDEGKYPWEE